MITIYINGEAETLAPEFSVQQLVEKIGLSDKRIAIECNACILPRSEYANHQLKDGDKLEIVHAIGGG